MLIGWLGPKFQMNILPQSSVSNKPRNIQICVEAYHLHSRWYLALFIVLPWRWRRYISPKHRLTFNGLHGDISRAMVALNLYLSITLERLERLQPNLVHILLYVCVRIYVCFIYIYISPKHQFPKEIWMIHVVEEINLLLLLSNHMVMTSRLATVGQTYPRKHIVSAKMQQYVDQPTSGECTAKERRSY
jgi:hypothetical protein